MEAGELVRKAQERKSKTQDLADRAARLLTIISLSVAAITFIAWLFYCQNSAFAVQRAVTVMVISCPHALGLAIPLVVAVSTSLAAKSGLLIRDRQAFERARDLQAVVFDKTGTLTEGSFGVTDVLALAEIDETMVLTLAASLEANSEHPIATGIMNSLKEKALEPSHVHEFRAIPGKGVEGLVQGKKLSVVSPGHLHENEIDLKDGRIEKLAQQGKTVVLLLEENRL